MQQSSDLQRADRLYTYTRGVRDSPLFSSDSRIIRVEKRQSTCQILLPIILASLSLSRVP